MGQVGESRRDAAAGKARRLARRFFQLPVMRAYYEAATGASKGGDAMLAAIAALLAFAALAAHVGGMYDSDGWFLLATGREVLEGGIPLENPFSQEAGLGIVVQQWAHDAYLAAAWSRGGFHAAEAAMALPIGLAAGGLWLVAGALSQRRARPALRLLVAAGALWMCSPYLSVRPTSWSMALMCASILACFAGREHPAAYAALPAIAAAWCNLQAALWPLAVFVGACFLLPSGRGELRDGAGAWLRSRKWLIAALAASCLASLANPYGLKGSLYSMLSMGAASYSGAIMEMKSPLEALPPVEVVAICVGMLLPFALCRGKRPPLPVPAAAMLACSLAAFLLCTRNVWILGVAFAFAMSAAISPADPLAESSKGGLSAKAAAAVWVSAVSLGFAASIVFGVLGAGEALVPADVSDGTGMSPLSSWEGGEESLAPIADAVGRWGEANGVETPRVMVTVDASSSVLEWLGVAVPFDLRPEIWDSGAITGREGYRPWADFVDGICSGDAEAERAYVEDGGWDLCVCQSARSDELIEKYGLEPVASTAAFSLLALPQGR